MALTEHEIQQDILRLAGGELAQFQATLQIIEASAQSLRTFTELTALQLSPILTQIDQLSRNINQLLVKLNRQRYFTGDASNAHNVILRIANTQLKEKLLPLLQGNPKIVGFNTSGRDSFLADLQLYRYFELRARLTYKISTTPADKGAELANDYNSLVTAPASSLVPEYQQFVQNIAARFPEIRITESSFNFTRAQKDVLEEVADEINWAGFDSTRTLRGIFFNVEPPENRNAISPTELTYLNSMRRRLVHRNEMVLVALIDRLFMLNNSEEDNRVLMAFEGWRDGVETTTRVSGTTRESLRSLLTRSRVGIVYSDDVQRREMLDQLNTLLTDTIPNIQGTLPLLNYDLYGINSGSPEENALIAMQNAYLTTLITELQGYQNAIRTEMAPVIDANAVVPDNLTWTEITSVDIEKQSAGWLMRAGYVTLKQLTQDLTMYTLVNKAGDRAIFDRIVNALDKRGDFWPRRAQYLKDRLQLFAACLAGTSSDMTLDYDSLYKGRDGWLGAQVNSEFKSANILRLLYGFELDHETLQSADPEEQERVKAINIVLEIICELYSEYDPATNTYGEFHATELFADWKKGQFKEAIQRKLAERLRLPAGTALNEQQLEAFSVAYDLHTLLDLRTQYAMPYYAGGWSPRDKIGPSIGATANRFYNWKLLYKVVGKTKQFFDTSLLVSLPNSEVREGISDAAKISNYEFVVNYGTPIWAEWCAPTLDEGITNPDERVVFTRRRMESPVTQIADALWPKRVQGEAYNAVPLERMLAAVRGGGDQKNALTLEALIEGAKAAEKFIEACEKGFTPSGDMHQDVTGIKKAISDMAEKISPTKSVSTINARYRANALYLYCRTSLLAFGEKYYGKPGYWVHYCRFLSSMRASLAAPTVSIEISDEDLPDAFKRRFGLPLGVKITILTYLEAILPESEEVLGGQGHTFVSDTISIKGRDYPRNFTNDATRERIKAAVEYHPDRILNNQARLDNLREEKEPWGKIITKFLADTFRGGGMSTALRNVSQHWHPHHGDGRHLHTIMHALDILPLTSSDKKAIAKEED